MRGRVPADFDAGVSANLSAARGTALERVIGGLARPRFRRRRHRKSQKRGEAETQLSQESLPLDISVAKGAKSVRYVTVDPLH